jgi:hypothetical protein
MSHGMTLIKFRNGRRDAIPRDAIVSVLVRYGCKVPQLREGSNEIGLPHEEACCSPFGEYAVLAVKQGEVTEFVCTAHRPPPSAGCYCFHLSMR